MEALAQVQALAIYLRDEIMVVAVLDALRRVLGNGDDGNKKPPNIPPSTPPTSTLALETATATTSTTNQSIDGLEDADESDYDDDYLFPYRTEKQPSFSDGLILELVFGDD